MQMIGVEKNLTNVIDYLTESGYRIHEFDTGQKNAKDFIDGFDAVVISGINDNIMGIKDSTSKASIIDARGMTPEEIKYQIEKRIRNN